MTDINASLKKTIDGEPGPQYKEKNKAEFNFIEGEDGVPYTYDKKVESRLTAIENKLDSVIDNGSVNTQLTGSNDEYELPVTLKGDNVELIKSYFNATVITDDNLHFSEEVSKELLSKYSALFFKVICSFRQDVRIYLYDGGTGLAEKGFVPISSSYGLRLITENEHKILVTPGSVRLRLGVKVMTPPEEGTITIELYGKKMTGGVGSAEADTRSS